MPVPIVSLIVVAYNAEKYLERCLNSIIEQSFKDFETIIVDDGSTDCTGAIADAYCQRDSRFQVIHQENKGVATARQAGLNASSGVYTIHVDSDDWIDSSLLEEVVSSAEMENADMVIFDFLVHLPNNKTEYCEQRPSNLDHWVVMGQTLHDLYGSLCNKLIRRDSIIQNRVTFADDLFACEDQLFVLSFLSFPTRIAYINKAFYHYDKTQNANSFVNSNPLIRERLIVLERISSSHDILPIEGYYNAAILHLAYEAARLPRSQCKDYTKLFKKHMSSIKKAKGFPFRVKLLTLLRIHNINIPVDRLKSIAGLFRKHTS